MNSFRDLTIEQMDSIRQNKVQSIQTDEITELFKAIKEIKANYDMGVIYPEETAKQINEVSKISISLIKQWNK